MYCMFSVPEDILHSCIVYAKGILRTLTCKRRGMSLHPLNPNLFNRVGKSLFHFVMITIICTGGRHY